MPPINAVADISHHNGNIDFKKAKAAGILGVIHKATEGFHWNDPMYAKNKSGAVAQGLLWGAYHFATGGDGNAQADHFLATVNPGKTDLLVLDLEENPGGIPMDLHSAEDFVHHINEVTGKFPGLYGGNYLRTIIPADYSGILRQCWLWWAQYGPTTPRIHPAWKLWTMWQYTDGMKGQPPLDVPGIGHCDRDMFNGSPAGLKKLWDVV